MAGAGMAAVLFDMDGTLVDSEKIWDVSLNELADWLGGQLSPAARRKMLGSNLYRSVALLHDDLGVVADVTASGRFLLERTRTHFARGLEWRPGARELLHAVRAAHLPTALVTSTHRELVELALATIGEHHFDAVVCGDEVTRNKPHPESYLRAAGTLGHPPGSCLAIEDSPTGVGSAQAAGCAVLVVPSEVPVSPAPGRMVVTSLAGLGIADLHAVYAELSAGTSQPLG